MEETSRGTSGFCGLWAYKTGGGGHSFKKQKLQVCNWVTHLRRHPSKWEALKLKLPQLYCQSTSEEAPLKSSGAPGKGEWGMAMEAEKPVVKWLPCYHEFNLASWTLLFSLIEITFVSQLPSWVFPYNKLLVTYLLPICQCLSKKTLIIGNVRDNWYLEIALLT